jgi:hypothetical protein
MSRGLDSGREKVLIGTPSDSAMNRRTVLRAVTASVVLGTGCVGGQPGGSSSPTSGTKTSESPPETGTPTTAETTTIPTGDTDRSASPCDRAFPYDVTAALSADCPQPSVKYLGADSATAETSTGTETASEFHDSVVVRLRTESTGEFELLGCIDSAEKGRVGISETLSGDTAYELQFGPFTHHGVNVVEIWVPGCELHSRWPRTA